MRWTIGICALAAGLWMLRYWRPDVPLQPLTASAVAIGCLCIGGGAWWLRSWWLRRTRRRLREMRDSALW